MKMCNLCSVYKRIKDLQVEAFKIVYKCVNAIIAYVIGCYNIWSVFQTLAMGIVMFGPSTALSAG